MPTTITMPQLGESVSEGTIGRWLKHEGDSVKRDESLVEIITDKVTAELPSPVAGRLVRVLVGDDQTVKVGTPIAEIEESAGAAAASHSGERTAQPSAATPTSASGAMASAMPSASMPGNGGAVAAPVPSASVPSARAATLERGEKISPLARRMAQDYAVDLAQVQGTGDGGRVRKEDILAYVAQRGQPANGATTSTPAPAPARPSATAPLAGDTIITPTPARRAIAEHMARSKQTSPHAWTVVEVDLTGLARWLDAHKQEFRQREGFGVSFQTFVIKATAEALREHPYLNASWTDDGKILLRKPINIGISIALEDNLIVPVIRDADTLSVTGIARTVADLVSRARAHRLQPSEAQGASFTVNNPGVFGTVLSMAIINQPNAGILTMDAVVKRPVVVGDAIAIRSMMNLSLSFDHRVIDGLTAAQFLGAIKRRLEALGPDIECA